MSEKILAYRIKGARATFDETTRRYLIKADEQGSIERGQNGEFLFPTKKAAYDFCEKYSIYYRTIIEAVLEAKPIKKTPIEEPEQNITEMTLRTLKKLRMFAKEQGDTP
jgi:hypothetical protein